MGENPSPLGEAFKVDRRYAPPAEDGGLGKQEIRAKACNHSNWT